MNLWSWNMVSYFYTRFYGQKATSTTALHKSFSKGLRSFSLFFKKSYISNINSLSSSSILPTSQNPINNPYIEPFLKNVCDPIDFVWTKTCVTQKWRICSLEHVGRKRYLIHKCFQFYVKLAFFDGNIANVF